MDRYRDIETIRNTQGKRYKASTIYPDIPYSENDIYVITTETDRLDNLAYQYYKDSSLYWIISAANPQIPFSSFFPPPNTQLRIPGNPSNIIGNFNNLNESR